MMASSSAAAQRELEEKLIQSGTKLSTPPSSTHELLSLLEKVESELKSIGQDPSVSMINVLDPIRKALIGTKLLGHSDEIIEVSVVSCICEIMRISAPVLPYDNREMKVIFHHIIASLEKLPDILSDCYSKAVRILEAIAKIRLCVMLLDLNYTLAVNVFQLFLKIIRPYHPHAVSKYMEDIMIQLIEESDEVSIDFQVSILESLRKKTMDTAPLSSLLGHHVLEKCAARLKPSLLELIKTMNLNFDDYTDVLGSVCREVPEGENMVENAGSVPPVEETSALQLPQVPQLDGTPTIMNNNNNLEPDGSLKTLQHCNQAEPLKDTDPPSDNAASKVSASPSETGKQSMPDVLAPNSENTHVNSGSSRKRGRPKKNQTELTMRKRSEWASSPSLTVSIKKEKDRLSDAENSSLEQNDLQSISRRTRHSRKQALNREKKVESELKSIGQYPSVSTRNVLEPIKKALIQWKLLRHSDKIIKVSVASCICEIMRISAPVLPFDNTQKEVVFHQIIASLEKLYYIDSNCYSKALRVLEAVAKYRLCVMLLDFDYVLAVNVFQLFLKIISLKHTNDVLRNMVDIMSQLIEERDEVSLDFQVSILDSLRKKTLATAPCSTVLGKEVLEKCAARLKPCLLELMRDMNMNLDDYCKVLGSILHEVPDGQNTGRITD